VLPDRRREVLTFLAVGGAGYVVDVLAFNWLRVQPGLAGLDPTASKVLAVAAAMVVTYVGNRMLTWRGQGARAERRREISLFVLFNLVGLGISVALLALTHDLLDLTSRLSDNLSANVVGLALGTAFRYWSYRHFVFVSSTGPPHDTARTSAPGSWQRTLVGTEVLLSRWREADLRVGPVGDHGLADDVRTRSR
jgi:putative flippase GtrA